jgi:hypothetical protein
MKKNLPSKFGFLYLRLLLVLVLCSTGAALGTLSLAIPTASKANATTTARPSIPPMLARIDPDQADRDSYSLTNFQRLISPSQWFASTTIKRGLLRTAPTGPRSTAQASGALTPFVSDAVTPTASIPVRDLPAESVLTISTGRPEEGELSNRMPQLPRSPLEHDPVIQSRTAPTVGMPPVGASFEGLNNSQACNGCIPPDPNGAVGPNHYVQMVNEHFAVYSKTGTLLSGPKAINSLWSATPNSTCATHNNGDPIVIYDQVADRWLLSQFTVQSGSENYAECIAISQTPDPTGAYWLYQFDESADTFHDYPHLGIWPDGYYMTTNLFPNSALLTSTGAGAWAFERPKMLLGQAARYVYFDETPLATNTYTPGGQLPTSLEGKNQPPAGAPNYFVEVNDANQPNTPPATGLHDEMHIWKFHVDWTTPANSTFGTGSTAPALKPGFSGQYAGNAGQPNFVIPVADYVAVACEFLSGPTCIPQKVTPPQPTEYLEALGDRLMYRVTYRNLGDHESLLVSHTAQGPADQPEGAARAGVRWYEFRNLSTTPTVYQQSTFAPLDPTSLDGPLWRWMGSAAMDHSGDIAIAYSASGPNYLPSLHYAGRLVGDPPNQLTQGEAVLFQGLGIETAVPNYLQRNRWGDYSNLTVDPTDDCTFWYTNEYLPFNTPVDVISAVEWHTRIGSFKFPQCVPPVLQLAGVVSRKVHGGTLQADITLPLTGQRGVECRSPGQTGTAGFDYKIVFTFVNNIPVGGCGTTSTPAGSVVAGPNANQCTVNLNGLPNAQYTTVTLNSVTDVAGNSGPASAVMGLLIGDVNGDVPNAPGLVDSGDVFLVRQNTGQATTLTNFRKDINASGVIDSGDVFLTRQKTGTQLPSQP